MAFKPNTIGAVFIGPITWVITFLVVGLMFSTKGNAAPVGKVEEFQVGIGTIMAIAGTAAGAVVTAYLALLRYTIGQEKKRIDDKFTITEKSMLSIESSLKDIRDENKRSTSDDMTMKLDFVRLQSLTTSLAQSISDMQQSQVQRVEWESRMDSMEAKV
jgi:hypothetical protein